MIEINNAAGTIFDNVTDDATSTTADLLGAGGVYVNGQGLQKVALVVNTPESTTEGTDLPVPNTGHVHLVIFTAARGATTRLNVPLKATAEQIPDYAVDGKLVGYFEAK